MSVAVNVKTRCCFCAETIQPDYPDPVPVAIGLDDAGDQELHAHARCLHERVHPSIPLYVLPMKTAGLRLELAS